MDGQRLSDAIPSGPRATRAVAEDAMVARAWHSFSQWTQGTCWQG
jgi:hypothetical protein